MMTRPRICIALYILTSTTLFSACALERIASNTPYDDFDYFYQAHGGEDVLGEPVGKMITVDAVLSARCYVGGCLQRHAAREIGGRVTLSPLPEEKRPLEVPASTKSDDSGILFLETGQYVQGELLRYFQLHGGVRFFGYPLSSARTIGEHQLVQHFERAILIWDNSLPPEQSVYLEPVGHTIYANLIVEIESGIKAKNEANRESALADTSIAALVQAHGGHVVFGKPIGQPVEAKDGFIEQVFTNAVLVADPDEPGGARLRPLGILGYGRTDPAQPPSDVPGAAYFPSTGHSVLAAFKTYYDLHGGENIFGAPITEAFVENGALTQYFENLALVWRQDAYGHGIPGVTPKELGVAYAQAMTYTMTTQPAAAAEHRHTGFAIHVWATLPFALPQDRQNINVLVVDLQSLPIAGVTASLELNTSQGASRMMLPATGSDGRTSISFPISTVGEGMPTVNYRVHVEVGSARETVTKSFNIKYLRSQ